jgi:uncharacterized protein DUF1259
MRSHNVDTVISRRAALLGGGAAVGGLAAGPLVAAAAARTPGVRKQSGKLPSEKIQTLLELEGSVSDGVLSIDVSRNDIGTVRGPLGVEFDGSFEIDGTLTFQPLGNNLAFFNGDLPLKPKETQPFIDAIIANHLVFQAFHQHYIETNPNVWFIHWRGVGAPLALAAAVRNVLRVTETKLPQKMPSKPKSPLDAKRLATILHGDGQIGDEGVVTVNVLRSDRIVIDGVQVSPEANISTNIEFKPLGASAAWAAPDFAMTGTEVMKVVPLMRRLGWFSGCLYNQETSETPQLYFDHMLKRGDAYSLAAEIRKGLDLTRSK